LKKRIVVTGMGAITPLGIGVETLWDGLVNGRSAVQRITRFDPSDFPTQIAAEVPDFNPTDFMDRKEARRMDRFTQFAVAAAGMALQDAGLNLDNEDPFRVGVVLGTGIGGMETLTKQFEILYEKGPSRMSPFFVPMMIANMAAGMVAILAQAKGPNTTVVTACAASANAVGEAARILRSGDADIILTGGTEAAITPIAVAGFCAMKAMSTNNQDPEGASRPFDARRDGFVMGEGAGILVLETLEHALKRGARIYAEIAGYGTTSDAYHITAPDPEGIGEATAMRLALADAEMAPEDIQYINAHGTSTPANDKCETKAIKAVFGDHARRLAISSTKSMIGHLLGAAGAVELMAAIMTIERGIIHPTINYQDPDPECDLDYVPNQARPARVDAVLSNSFGFGGQNASLVVSRYTG